MSDGTQEWMAQASTLTKLWLESFSRLAGSAFAFTPGASPPEATRQVRDSFLRSMDHSMEAYMRSEPFLQGMRQALDVAMEMRKQFASLVSQTHHAAGTASEEDVRSLMLAVRHAEERLSRRVDQMMWRFDEIERKLAKLQDSVRANGHSGQ